MMQENNKRAPLLWLYEKEVERESAKIADMKAKGSDLYDLKKKVHHALFLSQFH